MKKALKIIAAILAVVVVWVAIFAVYLLNWGNITARQIAVKYETIGYPQGGVLLAGSSTMQIWDSSQTDLGPLRSVNVGVSGTVVSNWFDFAPTLIYSFAPDAVVLYIGANDLHNDNTPPAEVFAELELLFAEIHENLPRTKIYFTAVYTTGAHSDMMADDQALNAMVEALAQKTPYLVFVDCATPLLAADGTVRNDVFLSDLVHLNETGYAIFSEVVRQALLADFPAA